MISFKQFVEEVENLEEKNVPTSPEKWAKAKSAAKSKFAVYPSAYANGWASKKYKSMGGGWRTEEVELDEMDKTQTPPGRDGNSVYDPEAHAGKKAYPGKLVTSNKVKKDLNKLLNKSFNKAFNKEEIEEIFDVIEEMVEAAAAEHNIDSELLWEKLESVSDEDLIEESAAWQRKAGKDPKGGLNRKGIASYRRENPGSKLSMAVTTKPSKLKPGSKAANRRKSFCARMGGMQGAMKKPNGEPTRKALALRKWNC